MAGLVLSTLSFGAVKTDVVPLSFDQTNPVNAFENLRINISGDPGDPALGGYVIDMQLFDSSNNLVNNAFEVFNEGGVNATTLFNIPGYFGAGGGIDVVGSFFFSDGTTASLSLLTQAGGTFLPTSPIQLLDLPISTAIGPGVYNLIFTVQGITDIAVNDISGTATFSGGPGAVTAVPEPTSLALLAAVGLVPVARRWTRRKLDA
jgi:hypothetical protein